MNQPNGEICARHYATGQPVRVAWKAGLLSQIAPGDAGAAADRWIAPLLFDVQVNGFGGVDFQQDDLTAEQLLIAARSLRAAGCGRFLLTLITDEWERLAGRLQRARELRAQSPELQSAIAGWHIEGPFLSSAPGFHGAHNPDFMLDPTPARIRELWSITGDDLTLLTLSPERAGAVEAISLAVSLGMKVSLGHTNASVAELARAVAAGATGFTHLGNGCPRELDRHDNIIWRVFETAGLMVSLIPDRIHVSDPLFRLVHRVLPPDSIFYTTDAMSAAGMPPGVYGLGRMRLEVGADQVVRQPGKPLFAGSALRPIDGVFRAAAMLGCPWQVAWHGFAENPARFLGLKARLEAGAPANFCVLRVEKNRVTDLEVQVV